MPVTKRRLFMWWFCILSSAMLLSCFSALLLARQTVARHVGPKISRSSFSITFFTSPKSFTGSANHTQRRAIRSWLRLQPQARVVLLGVRKSVLKELTEFGTLVTVEEEIQQNFQGMPLFHSMVLRALAASSDISVLLNADILLFDDFTAVLEKLIINPTPWLAVAARWDVEQERFDERTPIESGRAGQLHSYGGVDIWAWNQNPNVALHAGHMPPFTLGRGRYDNWLVHESIAAGYRRVIDISEAATAVHINHQYREVVVGGTSRSLKEYKNFWSANAFERWDIYLNSYLAFSHGTFRAQNGTSLSCPWKLMQCEEYEKLCLIRRVRPGLCPCEHSVFAGATLTDPRVDSSSKRIICGSRPSHVEYKTPFLRQFNLSELLEAVAQDGSVVVSVVSWEYRDPLMSLYCRLQALGVHNFLVIAMDERMLKFAYSHGVATFLTESEISLAIPSNCSDFGSKCFRQRTKLKSRAVLSILELGYNVLFTDVDIAWKSDPRDLFSAFGSYSFYIQSNEPDVTAPANGIRRMNSGFYFVRSTPQTIEAFRRITSLARESPLSEQPHFYSVLCGEKGEFRVGSDECVPQSRELPWSKFLPRDLFPNGAYKAVWNSTNIPRDFPKAVIVHNNWIHGLEKKIARFRAHDLWFWQNDTQSCRFSWVRA